MEGYAKVAQMMAAQDEFAILRRFRILNMQNLLYLQAEIIHLESELRDIVNDDARIDGRQDYAHDWWSLAVGEKDGDNEQWEKVLQIREKLESYSLWEPSFQ